MCGTLRETDLEIWSKSLKRMARPKRFELLTPRFVAWWCGAIELDFGAEPSIHGGQEKGAEPGPLSLITPAYERGLWVVQAPE